MLNSIKGFFSKSVKCWRGLCEVEGMFGVVGKVGGTLLYSRHSFVIADTLINSRTKSDAVVHILQTHYCVLHKGTLCTKLQRLQSTTINRLRKAILMLLPPDINVKSSITRCFG